MYLQKVKVFRLHINLLYISIIIIIDFGVYIFYRFLIVVVSYSKVSLRFKGSRVA